MAQIILTDVFQSVAQYAGTRQFFLAGAPSGSVVVIEAGVGLAALDGVEVARLVTPNPAAADAAGTATEASSGSAQFLRYRVVSGGVGSAIWMSSVDPVSL